MLFAALLLLLVGCGGEDKAPDPGPTVDPSAPVISQVTQTPLTTKAGYGIRWNGPANGCTRTLGIRWDFRVSDREAVPTRTLHMEWEDSLGLRSGEITSDFLCTLDISASYGIPPNYNEGIDDGASWANCTDMPRTYTYRFWVTDETNRNSNVVTGTWTITE